MYYFTRGSKVGLRKIGPETAIYQEISIRVKHEDLRVLVEVTVTAAQIYQWTLALSLASEPQSTGHMLC